MKHDVMDPKYDWGSTPFRVQSDVMSALAAAEKERKRAVETMKDALKDIAKLQAARAAKREPAKEGA